MSSIPYRIRIGVTGHRKGLPDEEVLGTLIKHALGWEAWCNSKRALPESVFGLFDAEGQKEMRKLRKTPIRFSIHTCLAEGADRAVAKAVCTTTEDGWLHAVLPFEAKPYEETFDDEATNPEFRELLARDPSPRIVAPTPTTADERHAAYFAAGKVIVDVCDVMIAVWDGEAAGGAGGTAEVVAYARSIQRPLLIIRTDGTPHIEVERGAGLTCIGLREQDDLNREALDPGYVEGARAEHYGSVENLASLASEGTIAVMERHLWPFYTRASTISKRCKREYQWVGTGVYILSALAVLSVLLGVFIGALHLWAFVVEVVLLVLIFLSINYAHRNRLHQRWLQHRYLTERCRVLVYLFLFEQRPTIDRPMAGLNGKVNDGWVTRVYNELVGTLERAAPSRSLPDPSTWIKDAKKTLRARLVNGQINYHGKKREDNERSSHRMELYGRIAFFAALVVAVSHIVLGYAMHAPEAGPWGNVLAVLAVMLPVSAAAFEGVRRQREFGRLARVNARMVAELKGLDKELGAVDSEEKLKQVLVKIDRSLSRESAEWLGLLVDNDVELMP